LIDDALNEYGIGLMDLIKFLGRNSH